MATVQTVRGPIDAGALGRVLMRERVFVLGAELQQNYPGSWDEEAQDGDAVAKLRELKQRGIDTIVDPTVIGLGRYLPRIQRINGQVDIDIIPATGVCAYNDVPFQFHSQGPGLLFEMPEPMVDIFVHDLQAGIADTGVRAPFLKCAIDAQGMTPGVERVMRAVGAGAHPDRSPDHGAHRRALPRDPGGKLLKAQLREQVTWGEPLR